MKRLDVRHFSPPRKIRANIVQEIIPANSKFLVQFLDLLTKIFVYDPARRITAKEALQHPWFKENAHPDDGTEAARIRAERSRASETRLPPIHP